MNRPALDNARARRLARLVAAFTLLAPCVAVGGALATAWTRGVACRDLALLAAFYVVTQLGITAGFHRLFAHKSFETTRIIQTLLAVAGSMAMQGSLLFWVATHRRHHQFSDRPGDPHSPNLGGGFAGLLHAHVGWMLTYEMPPDWSRSVPDLLRDEHLFRLNRQYFAFAALGLLLPAVIGLLASGSWQGAWSGFVWGGWVRIFCVHHATWTVNSLCHRFGAHPYPTRDHSGNLWFASLFTLGESWHNNHHAAPASARHGFTAWQLDPTYGFIRLLEKLGVAWDVKLASTRMS